MNKKTIFLLPLDLKGKKQTRITPKFIREVYNTDKKEILPEHIQKKKNNIFTVELNRLIGKISEKNKNTTAKEDQITRAENISEEESHIPNPVKSDLISPQTNTSYPQDENDFELLNKIYANQNALENTKQYLEVLFATMEIKAYSIFFYEPHTYTYYPIITNGISDKTKTNLLFQSNDKFLQNKSEGYIHLYFQPVLMNDIFFKKKLSPVEFSNYGSVLLKFLDVHNLPGLISLFFPQDANPSSEDIDKLSSNIDKKLKPLVPFLNSYFQAELKSRLDSFDILRRNIHAIRIQSQRLGQESFYFTKIKIKNFTRTENAFEKKKSISILLKNHLLPDEGLINISFNELLTLTKENEVEKILKYISENTKTEFEFQVDVLKYPENGKNLYLYF